ncbi:unnamed protein product [Lactuca saligna]|uniref:Uncharacterized protein n=1 Tax=Lactuca saligna TaxID=75948 RepID=A0AA36A3M7_LACSI|nr:unnamed protein product [Lactuca saligna]
MLHRLFKLLKLKETEFTSCIVDSLSALLLTRISSILSSNYTPLLKDDPIYCSYYCCSTPASHRHRLQIDFLISSFCRRKSVFLNRSDGRCISVFSEIDVTKSVNGEGTEINALLRTIGGYFTRDEIDVSGHVVDNTDDFEEVTTCGDRIRPNMFRWIWRPRR